MLIGGLQKTSLLDYPGKISAIVFTQGCNFRCPYCHNPELLKADGNTQNMSVPSVLDFLKTRTGKLDGVVITGGEPCLHADLPEFIKEIKQLGFLVKLDTNGSCPGMLERLINENLLDYIAMDIKAPPDKYPLIAGVKTDVEKIQQSAKLIMESKIDYEFRTTVLKSMLNFEDFEKIGSFIRGARRYYLQKFVPSKALDENLLTNYENYTNDELMNICELLRLQVNFVHVR